MPLAARLPSSWPSGQGFAVRRTCPRPAIRPYPLQYSGTWTDRSGETLHIRPIRPEDETLLVDFHRTLSEQAIYQRYFENLGLDRLTSHHMLSRVCCID